MNNPAEPGQRLSGFLPVFNSQARVLILGSFPSEASLENQRYYAHPQNQFWKLLAQVLGEPLVELPYPRRLDVIKWHRIALWDVYAVCEREGSLDAKITNAIPNDFLTLFSAAPNIKRIFFNGRTAGRFTPWFRERGYETQVLPSSSPANATLSFEQKLEFWREIAN